jgi:hypothetical protein
MAVKRIAVPLLLTFALAGCAAGPSAQTAAASPAPPGACTPGASFATTADYAAGQGPDDRTGGAATPEEAARDYASAMRPPGPADGWTRVPEETPTADRALVAAADYRMRAYRLVKDGTWVVASGYRCADSAER